MGTRAGLDGCEKSRFPTGIRSPDRPDRSESLYRLSCPGPVEVELRISMDNHTKGAGGRGVRLGCTKLCKLLAVFRPLSIPLKV